MEQSSQYFPILPCSLLPPSSSCTFSFFFFRVCLFSSRSEGRRYRVRLLLYKNYSDQSEDALLYKRLVRAPACLLHILTQRFFSCPDHFFLSFLSCISSPVFPENEKKCSLSSLLSTSFMKYKKNTGQSLKIYITSYGFLLAFYFGTGLVLAFHNFLPLLCLALRSRAVHLRRFKTNRKANQRKSLKIQKFTRNWNF